MLRDRRYEGPARSAAIALGAIGPPASPAVPALLETLASAGAHIRERPAGQYLVEASSHALGRIGFGPAALPELFRMLRSPQPRWYDSLPSAFRGAPDEAVAGLAALLSSADPLAAARTGYALGEMGPRAAPALPALVEALRREPCKVRSAAAFALAQIGVRDEAALRGLEKLLEDPDEGCRSAARGALVKLAPS